jgi:hypothetical protein
MSTPTQTSDRFTSLPDEPTLAATAAALDSRGFGVEVVDDLDAAREAVLALVPEGASVMTFPSVTLEATGIAAAIDESGRYDSIRVKGAALDRATQLAEIKAMMMQPEFALGSVHAITLDGVPVISSALGSQLAAQSWGAGRVIFVVGAQKLVPDLATARERILEHSLPLENARALEVYGIGSYLGKILEMHRDDPGRTHIVLIRAAVGY